MFEQKGSLNNQALQLQKLIKQTAYYWTLHSLMKAMI